MPEEGTTMPVPVPVLADEEQQQPQEMFRMGVHEWVETQQVAHGVRHDDYKQYHSYCTRRLSKLRHHPSVKKELVHSTKFQAASSGSSSNKGRPRHAFCSLSEDIYNTTTSTIGHANFLWVLLVSVECAWELQKAPSKTNRSHFIRRLNKAQQFATQLEDVAKETTDPTTYQECQAYAGWMKGNWALEKGDYKVRANAYCCVVDRAVGFVE
jgi:hypothetical protein